MKVLCLTNEFEDERFGGSGTAVTGIVHMLARQGIQQVVVAPRSGLVNPLWKVEGEYLRILWLPRNNHYFGDLGRVNTPRVLDEFPELKEHYDLIHIHAINFASLAYGLAEGKIPLLYSVSSLLRTELADNKEPELQAQFAIQEDILLRCQRIHLLSQSERRNFAERFPHLLAKTVVLPLGYTPLQEYWQRGSPNALLYVGRLIDYKGIEDLLKALMIVKLKGRSFTLDVVGQGMEDYEQRLKIMVQLGSRVKFHGWVNDEMKLGYMKRASVLIVPSHRESFGLVALEGMAFGIPLIASTAKALSELVNPACALTFQAGNVMELAQVIIKALDNPSYIRSLAQNAKKRVVSFEWLNLVGRYLELYTQTALAKQ